MDLEIQRAGNRFSGPGSRAVKIGELTSQQLLPTKLGCTSDEWFGLIRGLGCQIIHVAREKMGGG